MSKLFQNAFKTKLKVALKNIDYSNLIKIKNNIKFQKCN